MFGAGAAKTPGVFCGPWWITRNRDLASIMRAIGIGNFPSPLAQSFARLLPSGGAFHADAVVAKTNLRGFYVASGLTLKFSGAPGPLCNEIAVRQSIVDTPKVKVPAIHRSSAGATPYILESLVRGARPTERDITGEFVANLWSFHLANGMSAEALSTVIDPAALEPALDAALRNFPERAEGLMRGWKKVRDEIDWRSAVPVGLTHGDLSASNILVGAEGIHLLDWEQGGRGVVLDDFAKLALRFPQIVAPLRDCYENWLGAATPDVQRLLAICLINRFAGLWLTPETAVNRKLQLRRLDLAEMALKNLAEET